MQAKKAKIQMVCALFFIGLSILLWFIIIPLGAPLRTAYGSSVGINSRTFPYFTAVLMGIFSAVYFCICCAQFIKAKREAEGQQENTKLLNLKEEARALSIFGFFALYAFLFTRIGYTVSTLLVPTATLFFLGERKIMRYLIIYGAAGVFFIIFEKLLLVQLP